MSRTKQLLLLVVAAVVAVVLVRSGKIDADTALLLAALIPSVILHEVSHGAIALVFGDDTAQRAGRLTLNPIAHVDPFGTLLLPAMMAIASGGTAVLGYAKPVPVNPRRLRNPLNQALVVSLGGPAVNIGLALLAALAYRVLDPVRGDERLVVGFVVALGIVNVVLAVFNLIPVPPLDGSAVVERFLPMRWWEGYLRLRQYSILLLLVLVFWFPLDRLFVPALRLWERLL